MRGEDRRSEQLFSYVNLEARIPSKHPLRRILALADDALRSLSGEFSAIYALSGRSSIPPERLLRALLLQAFYTIRSERQLMEQLEYNRDRGRLAAFPLPHHRACGSAHGGSAA